MATDTKNEDIVKKYFDMVQEEIKRLISEDKEIKPEQVQTFNDEIFNQDNEMMSEIQQFIDQASTNNLDVKRIAKTLYDKFKVQVKNNVFNQKDVQNVPNKLMGERRFIKTYENDKNELENFSIDELEDMKYEIQLKMSDFIRSLKPIHTDSESYEMDILPNGPTFSKTWPGMHNEYNEMKDKVREIDLEIDSRAFYDDEIDANGFPRAGASTFRQGTNNEHKFIKTYESFMNEYYEPSDKLVKPKWNGRDYKILYDKLSAKAKEGEYFLTDLGNPKPKTFKELITLLKEYDTEESNDLAYEISTLIGMNNFFGAEREIELSKLN